MVENSRREIFILGKNREKGGSEELSFCWSGTECLPVDLLGTRGEKRLTQQACVWIGLAPFFFLFLISGLEIYQNEVDT